MENNNLAYVHQGGAGVGAGGIRVGLQAWDGEDYSQLYDLKIQVKRLIVSRQAKHFRIF